MKDFDFSSCARYLQYGSVLVHIPSQELTCWNVCQIKCHIDRISLHPNKQIGFIQREHDSMKFTNFWAFWRKRAKFCSPRKSEENSVNFPTAHCFSWSEFLSSTSCLLIIWPDFASENSLFSNFPLNFLAKIHSSLSFLSIPSSKMN